MTTEKLIAAAQRIATRSNVDWEPNDSTLLAEHILDTVREDDDEAVTVEWCDSTSLPLSDTGPYQRRYEITGGVRLVAEACPGGFKPCMLFTGSGDGFRSRNINRGQVRDLCRVLGVPLSEA